MLTTSTTMQGRRDMSELALSIHGILTDTVSPTENIFTVLWLLYLSAILIIGIVYQPSLLSVSFVREKSRWPIYSINNYISGCNIVTCVPFCTSALLQVHFPSVKTGSHLPQLGQDYHTLLSSSSLQLASSPPNILTPDHD